MTLTYVKTGAFVLFLSMQCITLSQAPPPPPTFRINSASGLSRGSQSQLWEDIDFSDSSSGYDPGKSFSANWDRKLGLISTSTPYVSPLVHEKDIQRTGALPRNGQTFFSSQYSTSSCILFLTYSCFSPIFKIVFPMIQFCRYRGFSLPFPFSRFSLLSVSPELS